jgi:hypothetical protein
VLDFFSVSAVLDFFSAVRDNFAYCYTAISSNYDRSALLLAALYTDCDRCFEYCLLFVISYRCIAALGLLSISMISDQYYD